MTTAADLLNALEALGAKLGLSLTVEAPPGTIDADMKAAIVERLPELLTRLAQGAERAGMRCDDPGASTLAQVQPQDHPPAETAAGE